MIKLFPILLICSIGFTQEMEVDGNLKVTGTVDANGNPITNVGAPLLSTDAVNAGTLASVLSDDGVYEYTFILVEIGMTSYTSDPTYKLNKSGYWKEENLSNGTYANQINGLTGDIESLFNDGWKLDSINGERTSWWIFKRTIADE